MKIAISILLMVLCFATLAMAEGAYTFMGNTAMGNWNCALGDQGVSDAGIVYQEVYCQIVVTPAGRANWSKGPEVKTVKVLYLIDCKLSRYGAVGTSFFGFDNQPLKEPEIDTVFKWNDVVGNSMSEKLQWLACGKALRY